MHVQVRSLLDVKYIFGNHKFIPVNNFVINVHVYFHTGKLILKRLKDNICKPIINFIKITIYGRIKSL